MKTIDNSQILLKSIDIELKKLIQNDIKAYRAAQHRSGGNNQDANKAA